MNLKGVLHCNNPVHFSGGPNFYLPTETSSLEGHNYTGSRCILMDEYPRGCAGHIYSCNCSKHILFKKIHCHLQINYARSRYSQYL